MQIKTTNQNPTTQFYELLQNSYDFFNQELFIKIGNNKALPNCIITMQRKKNTMGYFSKDRWTDKDGDKAHEIALNPAYFANHGVIEIFQTLVHEMCHLWQHEFGLHKSLRTYHNNEWATKMEAIGLQPVSADGKGNRTGQKMGDQVIDNGAFQKACIEFINQGNYIKWIDRYPAIDIIDTHHANTKNLSTLEYLNTNLSNIMTGVDTTSQATLIAAKIKQKSTYQCPACKNKLWGKIGINVICGGCHVNFIEV